MCGQYNIKTFNRARFQAFIENRSVAVVGRAEYLNEIEQGELIDSHDIVIRAHSNLPWPSPPFELLFENPDSFVPQSHHARLGTKTDAFAPSNLPYWKLRYVDDILPELIKRNCQWIIQHKIYNVPGVPDAGKRAELAVIDYVCDRYMPVFVASPEVFDDVTRELYYSFPMPGTLLIEELVRLNPGRLYVTGFSCYMDTRQTWLNARVALMRDHKPLYDLRYLRDRARAGAIATDDTMKRYFEEI